MSRNNKYPGWQLRHEGVLRWIFEHPAAKQKDCAHALGYTPAQILRISCVPEFRARLRELADFEFSRIVSRIVETRRHKP